MAAISPSPFRPGATALITGGASGIGLALAKHCIQTGMSVILADIKAENLEKADEYLEKFKGKDKVDRVRYVMMDVGKVEEWELLKSSLRAGETLSILALNAGTGLKGTWTDPSYFDKILSTNLHGVINGISTFLPLLQSTSTLISPSAIIITGSKQGITNPPGNAAYNASKAAVKSLAESLSHDLKANDPLKPVALDVHLLVPGWTYTGLSGAGPGSVEGKPAGAWTPDQVVEFLVEKMAKRDFYVICPDNEVTEAMDRKRMVYGTGDMVEGRPPLSRWREGWKGKADEWLKKEL